eukprot:4780359-Amphidinium_carterae.1
MVVKHAGVTVAPSSCCTLQHASLVRHCLPWQKEWAAKRGGLVVVCSKPDRRPQGCLYVCGGVRFEDSRGVLSL